MSTHFSLAKIRQPAGAYLPNTSFNGASLQGADFDGACMIGCDLTDAQLGPARSGAKVASLDSACLQAAVFLGVSFDRASLVNAAITGQGGMIEVSHYDEDGSLVGPEPLAWRPHPLPSAGSFTDGTVCPNTLTYKDNTAAGKTIAQMMEAPNPPTKWVPVGKLRMPHRSPGHGVLSRFPRRKSRPCMRRSVQPVARCPKRAAGPGNGGSGGRVSSVTERGADSGHLAAHRDLAQLRHLASGHLSS